MKIRNYLILALALTSCEKKAAPPPPPHEVTVVQPSVCDVPIYIDYIGHLVAKTSVEVRSQASGKIIGQYFVEGQEVKQGDLLVVIDPRPYEATLDKAEAALAETYASLQYAKETTRRYTPLAEEDFVSQLTFDQYVTNVLTYEAQLAQNRAALETAKIDLGYCYITAPMNCVTGKLLVKTGNYVDANADTKLTLLNQIQPILVDFWVPETDLYAIQEKQRSGELKLIIYPEPTHQTGYEGELTLIDNQVNTNTGAILLEGTLSNDQKILWPGHFVDVRLILTEKKGALILPSQAVLVGQKGHYLYVVKSDSTIEMRTVKIGQRYDNKYIAIESGVEAGEQVVLEGQLNLYPGMKVAIKTPQESS
ncbi:MAG: efflux RND transporter periplasmic adaptor subunit [Verrucomicrobia bacterium]|nr:efflux RND transporter periplasmic adaptor subunit [Verrucomicrobiota bacterium]